MSRVGKMPIIIPANTQVKIEKGFAMVKGPKGELQEKLHENVVVKIEDNVITLTVLHQEIKKNNALWGLFRNLINNMVIGVNTGFEKKLEIKGVGYRAQVNGQKLTLNLGFSHPVDFPLPTGISASVEGNFITISGSSKQVVGETAARIRKFRLPEPYKGKGIKYVDEIIRRKAGKAAGAK